MKALVFTEKGQPLDYRDVDEPQPTDDQVVVDIKAAGLNHRDNWILKGMYPGLQPDVIIGSDGAGVVDGREVIICPSLEWGDNERFPGKNFRILGMPDNGTFAEKFVTTPKQLVDKPAHLSMEQAATLPLGGVTAYRALFSRSQLQPREQVLISGIGGGVALLACQFAIAAGADVYVTSSSEEKIQAAVELGAKGGANYREEGWSKAFGKETGGFDVIIDSAGGSGFADLVKLTRPGARIALYGGHRGNWESVSPQLVFFRQINILGTTMGSDKDFADMVNLVNKHKIVPVVDSTYALQDVDKALQRMDDALQFGKIVLKI